MSDESPEAGVEESQAEAVATPEPDELTTLKKRLSGKDQAFTALKKESEATKAELEALRRWKAEKEEGDLTEVEKLTRRLAEKEAEAAEARAEANRIRLASTYPLAIDFYGDDPLPSEERLAALQKRLAATAATGPTDEADDDVDSNTPPRPPTKGGSTKPLSDLTVDQLRARVREEAKHFGNLGQVPGWVGG